MVAVRPVEDAFLSHGDPSHRVFHSLIIGDMLNCEAVRLLLLEGHGEAREIPVQVRTDHLSDYEARFRALSPSLRGALVQAIDYHTARRDDPEWRSLGGIWRSMLPAWIIEMLDSAKGLDDPDSQWARNAVTQSSCSFELEHHANAMAKDHLVATNNAFDAFVYVRNLSDPRPPPPPNPSDGVPHRVDQLHNWLRYRVEKPVNLFSRPVLYPISWMALRESPITRHLSDLPDLEAQWHARWRAELAAFCTSTGVPLSLAVDQMARAFVYARSSGLTQPEPTQSRRMLRVPKPRGKLGREDR